MANFVRLYYIRAKKHNGKALVGIEPRTFTIIKHIRKQIGHFSTFRKDNLEKVL